MKQEIIKPIVRVGNSAGVLLPKEWLNGMARVELVKRPIAIKQDILEIIHDYLGDVIGIYLTGSYARGEESERSDVDVLVITGKTNKHIRSGKYNIILITKNNAEIALRDNILPLLPMLREAKAIINQDLLNELARAPLTKRNLSYYVETTKSAISINKSLIELDKSSKLYCSDSIAYSLILRLRSSYIVDCLIKNKRYSNAEFIKIARDISGSNEAYNGYLRVKDKKREKEILPTKEAERIYVYLEEGIKKHEKWLIKTK